MGKEKQKKKNRNKSDYGDNFVAPDGGFGWVICISCGLGMLSLLPILQQFGLIYRDKLLGLGLTHSAITTLINVNSAISSLTGFLNGPMFRRFSYRQVGLAGAFIATFSIYLTSLSNSFTSFIFTFGICLAFGFGINWSANALVSNVYFKEKRPKSASWLTSITGIGPVVFPYIITYLVSVYDYQDTILIATAIAAHSIPVALLWQPVLWHVKKTENKNQELQLLNADSKEITSEKDNTCKICNCIIEEDEKESENDESSDDNDAEEIKDPDDLRFICQDLEIPVMHTSENFYNSKDNLAMKYTRQLSKYSVSKNLERRFSVISSHLTKSKECIIEQHKVCKCKKEPTKDQKNLNSKAFNDHINKPKLSIMRRFVNYFELDILKDLTFLNIIIGLTLTFFAEINFSILTPFILTDFGFSKVQMAFLMSLPAIPDLICRFLIQFLVKKIKWDNRVFYLLGIFGMTCARVVIGFNPSYTVMQISFFCLGIGKAFRTIFYAIIIPDYVPLKKLPAASGINRLFGGIFPLICGPFVGIIRDLTDYQVTVQCLNCLSMITVITWTIELIFFRKKKKLLAIAHTENV